MSREATHCNSDHLQKQKQLARILNKKNLFGNNASKKSLNPFSDKDFSHFQNCSSNVYFALTKPQ